MPAPAGGADRTSSTIFMVFAALIALVTLLATATTEGSPLAILIFGMLQTLLVVAFGILARNVEDTRYELERLRRAIAPPPPPGRADREAPEPASRWEAVWQRYDRDEA
jgi:hypothetical protein